ncbi:OPT oligopeptide transporter protein-domain-containing protein [Aspergillus keveii]|uniref:OPT oligopeptide transporter protein-domain-containing protein n=1 Tax=Aspergillus keveii TaxID=714993 RepID=A0ABR4FYI0_9EURO
MAGFDEKDTAVNVVPSTIPIEKSEYTEDQVHEKARLLGCSPQEFLEAEDYSKTLELEEAASRAKHILHFHEHDPNFNREAIVRLQDFVDNTDLFQNPDAHADLIADIKIEISLLTENSPYAEVRAVVSNKDDVSSPAGTIRAWTIGLLFVVLLSFVNQLFSVRQPAIRVEGAVVQLLSFPLGKAWEKWLPVGAFSILGQTLQLNPGKFNQKEHMLISIMANVASALPHSRYIIFTTWMERYFNMPFASSFGFQVCVSLSMNLMGFGLAGLARRFLVYPSFCIWPRSLVTVALNQSLHEEQSDSVPGPFRRLYNTSRYRFFLLAFACMFVWFWFPELIVSAVSLFNWLAWISPNNFNLTAITGLQKGLGFNPLPTFDWNIVTHNVDPLIVPFHVTFNMFIGVLLGAIVIIAVYWTNTYNTGYLPINTNTMFTNNGTQYDVSAILNDKGLLDDIALGFRSLFNTFKRDGRRHDFKDVHSRLMRSYRESPEWWYLILNVIAIGLGVAAVAGWPTNTNVGVVFFGIALAVIFTVPTGIIYATTGIEVEYNVLAEFIGGAWQPDNALAMNFFKGFGYVTVAHALSFANDLKLGHYLKVPPRQTFWCQVIATIVSALVCTGVMNFQITRIPDMCEPDQPNRFTCPNLQSYFTAAVLFGSLGARRLTKIHPVVILSGGHAWSPYNLGYMWPAVLPGWVSWNWLRRRYLGFWSKYNYVLSAAFSSGIAIAAVVIFFAVSDHGKEVDWIGNSPDKGCESTACTRLTLGEGEYFGPTVGTFVV